MDIRKNYVYNLIRILNQILFPLATIPYISRVIGAEGLGKVEYITAITAYGLLISNFGLHQFGSLEISRVRKKEYLVKKKTIEILNFQTICMLLGVTVFLIVTYFLKVSEKELIFIFSLRIILSLFTIEWYYLGKENFKYITVRDFIVKLTFLICIFILIKDKTDYYYYAIALVLGDSLGSFFNFRRMLSELNLSFFQVVKINNKKIIIYFKKAFPFFFAGFSVSIYLTLDKIMLGKIVGDIYVGYYAMSNRLIRIIMGLALALATVITPRLAYYYQEEKEKYFELIRSTTNFVLMLTFPIFVALMIMSPNIIKVVFGKEFMSAVLTLRILSVIFLIVPFANILGLQVLNITGNPGKYTKSVTVAAIVNFILNLFLIKYFKHNGAAAASVIAEMIGVFIQGYFVSKIFSLKKIFVKNILKYPVSSIVMGFTIYFIPQNITNLYFQTVIQTLLGIIVYFLFLFILREDLTLEILNKIKEKIRK